MKPESYIDLFEDSVLAALRFEIHNDELRNWAKANLAYISKYAANKYKEVDTWATMSSDYAPGEDASNFVYDVLLPAYEDGTLDELLESKQCDNMLKHAGMLCEYDDLTRDTSNDYAILDELKKLKDTYLGDDFYWWDGTSDGKTSKDEPLGYWDGRDGTSHYYIRTRYGTQFSIVVDTKQNITIRVFLGNKCYATYNTIDEFEEYLKRRNNARKQKKSISEYDEDQDEWISGAHENESTKIKNKNMTINEAKQLLEKHGYIVKEGFGDWAARTFKGETLLGQEMNRMDDKLANHFAGLLSLQMSRAAAKLKNDKYFVNDLIQKCNKLARQFRSAAKSDDDMVSGTFQLQTLLSTSFYRIMEELEQYDSRININSKVFDSDVPSAECKELAKEYGKG